MLNLIESTNQKWCESSGVKCRGANSRYPPMYKMNVLSGVALNRLNPNELTFGRSKVQVRSGHDLTF